MGKLEQVLRRARLAAVEASMGHKYQGLLGLVAGAAGRFISLLAILPEARAATVAGPAVAAAAAALLRAGREPQPAALAAKAGAEWSA
jgi:hypothetical protein